LARSRPRPVFREIRLRSGEAVEERHLLDEIPAGELTAQIDDRPKEDRTIGNPPRDRVFSFR